MEYQVIHANVPKYCEVQLQIAVNPFLEICFQKYFGRVITVPSALDPVLFIVSKLMSTGGIICGIIFS